MLRPLARFCAVAFLLFTASPALAGPLNLRWNACWGDGGVANKTFACNTNTGSDVISASFVPFRTVLGVTGLESRVDLSFPTAPPAWWQFRAAGSCRQTSLSRECRILRTPSRAEV